MKKKRLHMHRLGSKTTLTYHPMWIGIAPPHVENASPIFARKQRNLEVLVFW